MLRMTRNDGEQEDGVYVCDAARPTLTLTLSLLRRERGRMCGASLPLQGEGE
jgi:hypothetical protein